MQVYTMPILTAAGICFLLASTFTLPFAILQYRKHGFFSFWKTVLIFSFIFYCLSAYFLVIYPIPSEWNNCADINAGSAQAQTEPFRFISDITRNTSFQLSAPSSYTEILKAPAFYTSVFNVMLLFPLGVYLRYFFKKKRKWIYTMLIAFSVSLFFEITQRTALYGLFKCAYRIFDVDDLITNTTGAVLSFFMAPLFLWVIPSRDKLTEQMRYYDIRRHATYGAQLLEILLNIVISRFLAEYISRFFSTQGIPLEDILFAIIFFVMMVVVPVIWRGQTLGGKIIRVRLTPLKGSQLSTLNRRFWIVYVPFFISAVLRFLTDIAHQGTNIYVNLFIVGLLLTNVLIWLIYGGHILIRWMKREKSPFFNRYAHLDALRYTKKTKM